MALAGCPDSFLHHQYYQDKVKQTSPPSQRDLGERGFLAQPNRLVNQQEDDVDLEALVNDMNASFDSVHSACGMQSETVPLLQNGQHSRGQLPCSGTRSLQPQASPQPKIQRSQPVHILAVRRLKEEDQQFRTSSLPAIPNPFPELCGPRSSPVPTPGSLPPSQCTAKQDVKVFSEDGTSKVVEILADMTARDLCQLLVYKSHCVDDNSWTLVEQHPHLGLERCLEDHELVVQVENTMASESKFLFRKNYAKYEFFKNPMNFFPEQMVTWCQQSNGSIPQTQLLQRRDPPKEASLCLLPAGDLVKRDKEITAEPLEMYLVYDLLSERIYSSPSQPMISNLRKFSS